MFDSIAFEDLANLAQVGTGSFGKIYVADYLGTDVAVKTFLDISHQEVQVDLKKYIEREVDILREVRHPNVVQFMGCATHENKLLLVTEYVSGGNVKEWIADCSRDLGWRTRISIATDAARALAYLHAHDIIHRDMKSENLLVTENKRIKVCDFGFSRPTAKTAAEVRRLSFCGTDTHMAPEIILGMPFDSKVDIFSYGVVLCELALRTVAVDNPPCVPSIEEVEQDLKIRIAAPPGSEVAVMALGRVIPGFGLNGDLVRRAAGLAKGACVNLAGMEVEEMSLDDIVKAFVELALRCCDDEPCGRPTWKEILSGLRIMEKIAEREEPGHLGVVYDEDETEAEDFESLEDLVDCQEFGIRPMSRTPSLRRDGRGRVMSRESLNPKSCLAKRTASLRSCRSKESPPSSNSSKLQPPPRISSLHPEKEDDVNDELMDLETSLKLVVSTSLDSGLSDHTSVGLPARADATITRYDKPSTDVDSVVRVGRGIPAVNVFGAEADTKTATSSDFSRGHHRFSLSRDLLMRRCDHCRKRTGLKRHLMCDDCGKTFHKKCGRLTTHNCDAQHRDHLHKLDGSPSQNHNDAPACELSSSLLSPTNSGSIATLSDSSHTANNGEPTHWAGLLWRRSGVNVKSLDKLSSGSLSADNLGSTQTIGSPQLKTLSKEAGLGKSPSVPTLTPSKPSRLQIA